MSYAPRILVVDDEQLVRRLFEAVLAHDGYFVTAAGTGRDALRLIRETVFDVVVLDMSLPDMGGPELVTQIKSESPVSSILAISGFIEGMRTTAIRAGAAATLAKPVGAEELQQAVYQLIDASCSWMGQSG